MSRASEYVKRLSSALVERPVFKVPGPSGPVVATVQGPNGPVPQAYIDFVPGAGNGSVEPVLVIERFVGNAEAFAALVGWVAEEMNDKESE